MVRFGYRDQSFRSRSSSLSSKLYRQSWAVRIQRTALYYTTSLYRCLYRFTIDSRNCIIPSGMLYECTYLNVANLYISIIHSNIYHC